MGKTLYTPIKLIMKTYYNQITEIGVIIFPIRTVSQRNCAETFANIPQPAK